MRMPLSLLKTFVSLDISIEKIADTLTLLGIEVDRVIHPSPPFTHVIVGEVLTTKPHPQAERLMVTEVSDGRHQFQVVCGAPNCRAGIKTAFAKVGAELTDADGKHRTIAKATLRGVESHGMLCSASELRIWEDSSGILELPNEWAAGQDLTDLLWDPVFELSLTPNLGHCLSALGIARELGAALQKTIQIPKMPLSENPKSAIEDKIEVVVRDFKLAPRFMCRLVEGVKIGPSPLWLQRELLLCGQKPVHNAVDIANYVMMKLGQPLHVFDYDRIEGHTLEVAPAQSTQKIVGLDGIEREISPGMLMISDAKKAISIPGVLGGDNSAIHSDTKNILIEAAFFDPMVIRKAAKKLGLRTESVLRFEKGVDPNGVERALDEAAHWIQEICGGKVAKGKIDLKKESFSPKRILCRTERVNHLLGTRLSQTELEEIFQRLGFATQSLEKAQIQVDVPRYRFDVSEEIDLVEEAARLYGYNHIEKKPSRCITSTIPHDPVYLFEKEVRTRCIGLGLQEFLTSDLISPKLASLALEVASPEIALLKTLHAKTEEYSILRPSLLPSLLQVAKGNFDQKNQTFSAFETGRIHFIQKGQNEEIPMVGILLTGKALPSHWSRKPSEVDFYDLKGLLETLFEGLKVSDLSFLPSQHLSFHSGRQANVQSHGLIVGSLGEVHPNLLLKLDIKQRILYAELHLRHLMEHRGRTQMAPIPQFPSSERDWTLSLLPTALIETIFQSIQSVRPPLLEKVELIDLYQPEHGSQKNVTFRFTYRDPLTTISLKEVETVHTELLEKVSKLLAK